MVEVNSTFSTTLDHAVPASGAQKFQPFWGSKQKANKKAALIAQRSLL